MRTIHGNIISEDNLEPIPNTEYIYKLDSVWLNHRMISVVNGIIVENVEQMDSGSYSFNIKGDATRYECSYGWAFVENTKINSKLLKQIDRECSKIEFHKQKVSALRNKLGCLYKYK